MTKQNTGLDFRINIKVTKVEQVFQIQTYPRKLNVNMADSTTDKLGDFSSWVRICAVRVEMFPQTFYAVTAISCVAFLRWFKSRLALMDPVTKLHASFLH